MIKLGKLRFLQALSLLSTLWFGYWIFPFEILVNNKTLAQAWGTNYVNNILFLVSIFFCCFASFKRIRKYYPKNYSKYLPNLLKRKPKPQVWGQQQTVKSIQSNGVSTVKPMKNQRFTTVKLKKPRKLRVPGLRIAKRVTAGFMLTINLLVAFSGLSLPGGGIIALLFFLNVFFLLDYLHKTKKIKTDWKKETEK